MAREFREMRFRGELGHQESRGIYFWWGRFSYRNLQMQVEIAPLTNPCNHPLGRGKKKKKKIMDVEGGGTARRRRNQ